MHTVIMMLRVYALYRGNTYVLVLLLTAFSGQIALQTVALSHGIRESRNMINRLPCTLTMVLRKVRPFPFLSMAKGASSQEEKTSWSYSGPRL